MVDDNRALVGRILLISAGVLALLGALCWTGTLPVDKKTLCLPSIEGEMH